MTLSKEKYQNLIEEIEKHDIHYYVECCPLISDYKYDQLMKELEQIESDHPDWIDPNSPTQRVSETISKGFKQAEHVVPMLSLSNTYSEEELEEFITRTKKLLKEEEIDYSVELKMDGTAVSLRYEKGIFVRALTRGNGKKGDDITNNIKTIHAVPLKLRGDVPDVLEVRGEVYLPLATFKKLNAQNEKEGKQMWANPRNAAAGSLKLLDSKECARRGLSIVVYGIAEGTHQIATQEQVHQQLKKWGLPVFAKEHFGIFKTAKAILNFAQQLEKERKKMPFEIDGIVIKVNDLSKHRKMGSTGKSPRWAVAYKFAAEQAETCIHAITVQVGRSGILTPVAELDPVNLAGSTISRATLHNQDEITRKDIRVGDHVIIEKGGDVIPKVVEVIHEKRAKGSKKWHMPEKCPACDSVVKNVEGEVAYRCVNTRDCATQRVRRIAFFAGKTAFDIDHLGIKVVEMLVEKGLVSNLPDIFALTADQLADLEGFKEKSINNLLQALEEAKNVSLDRFILGLGIPFVGSGTAEILADHCKTIEKLFNENEEELASLEGVGEKIAHSVVEYFDNPAHVEEAVELLQKGVKPKNSAVITHQNHPFKDKLFVLTGTLDNYTRDEASQLIKERGGKTTGSVSAKTDYVLAGDQAGSKLKKAEKLGVAILDETQFQKEL